jgi:hypothetical protein
MYWSLLWNVKQADDASLKPSDVAFLVTATIVPSAPTARTPLATHGTSEFRGASPVSRFG